MEQLPGSIHLPIMDITTKAAEVLRGRENDRIICVCRAGVRSGTASVLLNALGFDHTSNMLGGMLAVRELRSK
jgi:rhodanese-related sulfurtransferase